MKDSKNEKIDPDILQIVTKRLQSVPPNISFSIGAYGDFSRDQLIEEVHKQTEVGKAAVQMQLSVLRKMANFNYDAQ